MQSAPSKLDAVILDLDGTVLDCSGRHYACYVEIANEMSVSPLERSAYWTMKRQRAPWTSILGSSLDAPGVRRFEDRFARRIEHRRLLQLDRLHEGAMQAVLDVRQLAALTLLVTMRRQEAALRAQLEQLGIGGLFDRIVCRGTIQCASKAELVEHFLPLRLKRMAWIGDTEDDIEGARSVGALACCVWNGLRDSEYLASQAPDFLVESVGDAVRALDRRIASQPITD